MQFESASLLGLVGLLYNVLTVGYVNSDQFEVRTVWQSLQWCTMRGFPGGTSGKEPECQYKRHATQVPSLGWEDPLEEVMATHLNILAWRIPLDRRSLAATVHEVTESWTRLKRLSTHMAILGNMTLSKVHYISKNLKIIFRFSYSIYIFP